MFARRPLAQISHHVGLDVGRDHLSVARDSRESRREVSGARTNTATIVFGRSPSASITIAGCCTRLAMESSNTFAQCSALSNR